MIRLATPADLKPIDSLRRADQESVGFIPLCRYEREIERGVRSGMVTVEEEGEVVGFAYYTRGWPIARIQQIAIRQDARRRERATALTSFIEQTLSLARHSGVTCRCRADLEATMFWESIGYASVGMEAAGRRKVPLVRYYKTLNPTLFDLGPFVATTAHLVGTRRGFKLTR